MSRVDTNEGARFFIRVIRGLLTTARAFFVDKTEEPGIRWSQLPFQEVPMRKLPLAAALLACAVSLAAREVAGTPESTLNQNSLGSVFLYPQQVQFTTPDERLNEGEYSDVDPGDEMRLTISTEYDLSSLNFSTRSKEAQSILTWRDMYLHGGKIAMQIDTDAEPFNQINISAGAAGAFHGYWTDDDSNNTGGTIGVTESRVYIFDLDTSLGAKNGPLTKSLGLSFNWIGLKNFNYRSFTQWTLSFDIDGLVAAYDQYMLGLYGNIKARLLDTAVFYADLGGLAGLSLGLGLANWLQRSDLEHPASFRSAGLFFRAGGEVEIGLKIKMFTLFAGLSVDYQISPWLSGLKTFYKDGHTHEQSLYQELTRASCSIGLKAVF
jgi:hypothetical protein